MTKIISNPWQIGIQTSSKLLKFSIVSADDNLEVIGYDHIKLID